MGITKEDIRRRIDVAKERKKVTINDELRYVFSLSDFYEKMSLDDFLKRVSDGVNGAVSRYFSSRSMDVPVDVDVTMSVETDYDTSSNHIDVSVSYSRMETDKEVVNRIYNREKAKVKRKLKREEDKKRTEEMELRTLERLQKKYRDKI